MQILLINGIALVLLIGLVGLLKRGNAFILGHLVFFLVFIPILHILEILSAGVTGLHYILEFYVVTNVVILTYLFVFVAGAISIDKFYPKNTPIIVATNNISEHMITAIFLGWFVFKVYLVDKYGVKGIIALQGTVSKEVAVTHFGFLDTALARYVTYVAVGASVAMVIRIATSCRRTKSIHGIVFVGFLLTFLVLGEAEVGARRFVMLLAIIALLVRASHMNITPYRFLLNRWLTVTFVVVAILGVSVWFQNVRNNIYHPEVIEQIASPTLVGVAKTAWLIATTRLEEEGEPISLLRPGPFELLYVLIEKQAEQGVTTRGELLTTSLEMIVPRVWVGDSKISINSDEIIHDKYGIEPKGLYLSPDLAASPLAIFLSDFGFWGVLVAPLPLLLSFILYTAPFRRRRVSPVVTLLSLSFLFVTAANVEGDLVTVLASMRDYLFGLIVIILALVVLRVLGQVVDIDRIMYGKKREGSGSTT